MKRVDPLAPRRSACRPVGLCPRDVSGRSTRVGFVRFGFLWCLVVHSPPPPLIPLLLLPPDLLLCTPATNLPVRHNCLLPLLSSWCQTVLLWCTLPSCSSDCIAKPPPISPRHLPATTPAFAETAATNESLHPPTRTATTPPSVCQHD